MRHATLLLLVAGLVVPAAAAGGDQVTLYPALAAAPLLDDVRAESGLKVLLPEIMHADDYTDGPRHFRLRATTSASSYDLWLVNLACPKSAPCRRIIAFSATRTDDAATGDIALDRGRTGSFTLGSCTGGGCTPASISWIERGARYTLYANRGAKKLASYANQAIRNGPRR
ncbi:MAG: hypothetical protein ACJ762_07685 [Solirubrobacteraceae bacterium]